MRSLLFPDQLHLNATIGWLMLGNTSEAAVEFQKLSGPYEENPDFVQAKCRLLIAAKRWDEALDWGKRLIRLAPERPQGWLQRSYCLHEMNRTREAFDALLPAARRFPRHHLIVFNLACYCCHLERFDQALRWVNRTMELVGI